MTAAAEHAVEPEDEVVRCRQEACAGGSHAMGRRGCREKGKRGHGHGGTAPDVLRLYCEFSRLYICIKLRAIAYNARAKKNDQTFDLEEFDASKTDQSPENPEMCTQPHLAPRSLGVR